MTSIRWLDAGSPPRDLAGGKAASLLELIAAGFAVPPGFVVTTHAYRLFSTAANLDAADPAARADRVLTTPLPHDTATEVTSAVERLTTIGGDAVVVRSSGAAEDGAEASFAGIYDSYLNLRSTDAVLDALRRCYASLWSKRALLYRARRGIDGEQAMAVIVQGFVPAEVSGIAFTVDPVTGEPDRVVISAAWGLGESVVSGRVTPDTYVVRKSDLGVIRRDIGEKAVGVYAAAYGGTEERRLDAPISASPSLSDADAARVARLAIDVERHAGRAQDIEWCLAAGKLWLLQAGR